MALSFLLRAGLVVGALSYLALGRDRPDRQGLAEVVSGAVTDAAGAALAHTAAALPPEAQSRVAREALAGLVRRAGQTVPEVQDPPSRDTLLAADRAPAWRGAGAP